MLITPVVFIIFNRPDVTARVFECIRTAAPTRLYVIADGPRNAAEKEQTDSARTYTEVIDWPCTVTRIYSTTNMGCRQRVISGLNEVFSIEPYAIILEDDCLPDPSFFSFCQTLLHRYRDNESVMHIGGNNFQEGQWQGTGNYYYSIYSHIWGWATWARAWKLYNLQVGKSDLLKTTIIPELMQGDKAMIKYWRDVMKVISNPSYTAWSFHWMFTIWLLKGRCILPNANLVLNIGFDKTGTHTKNCPDYYRNVKLDTLHTFNPPSDSAICFSADVHTFYKVFFDSHSNRSNFTFLLRRLKAKINNLIK